MTRPFLAAALALLAVLVLAPSALATGQPAAPSTVLVDAGYKPDVRPLTPIVPRGVHIAGVNVGGLQADTAVRFVRASFAQPLVVVLAGRWMRVSPADLGAVAYAQSAVRRALALSPGRKADLVVNVPGAGVRRFVERVAASYDRSAKPRRFAMRNFRPMLTAGVPGRRVDRSAAIAAIVGALTDSRRIPVKLPVSAVAPQTPRVADVALIVIRRQSNSLELFRGVKLVRRFGVATGQAVYPTPLGTFAVVVKQRNPWWYPPPSPWAKGEEPVPPGPSNPLGTRWMGLSAPLVGIHGTPNAASIGYSLSHGCIRMRIPEAEWLFERVDVGTKVMIVPA